MALLRLGYWNIRGLAAPLRMMLCYRKVEFENKTYRLNEDLDRSVWLADAKPALREENALINLPYIQDGDVIVSQSNACLSYLGRKLNLWGKTEREIISCEQLLCEAMDLRNSVVAFCYGRAGNPSVGHEVETFIESTQVGILSKLEMWLQHQPDFSAQTPFFVGKHATAPDFHIFELLDQLNLLAKCNSRPAVTESTELLLVHSFYEGFKKVPENEVYLSSVLAKAPCNNLHAVFGSLSGGGRWEKGVTLPEDISGVY